MDRHGPPGFASPRPRSLFCFDDATMPSLAAEPQSGPPERPTVEIVPGGPVVGNLRPPGSKSLTNRALLCAAMARGPSQVSGALRSADTDVMIESLRRLGVAVDTSDGGRELEIDGSKRTLGRRDDEPIELFVGNSGTTIRFLTAMLSAAGGHYRLTGIPRMHQRPIGDLVRAIEPVIRGRIWTESPGDCPPVGIAS
jgi:3-phosphoshikimate 1-carboxyvinyltransferase